MRKLFVNELKKYIWAFVLLTAICAIPYILSVPDYAEYGYPEINGNRYLEDPALDVVATFLGIYAFLVPALVFSFRMQKRGVDLYYSLPIKRWKLYFVKTMVGALLVFVPFTIAFLGGFLKLYFGCKGYYQTQYYVPAYFCMLFFGACLYLLNTFLFTRANSVVDGIVFMIAYICLPYLLAYTSEELFGEWLDWRINDSWFTVSGLSKATTVTSRYICGKTVSAWYNFGAWDFIFAGTYGVVAGFLLFFNLRFDKAENAEQCSESWFGYKTLIPLYMISLLAQRYIGVLAFSMVVIGAVVATVAFQRKFRFSWKWWLMIAGAVVISWALQLACYGEIFVSLDIFA